MSDQRAERRFVAAVLTFCAVVSVLLSLWCIYIDNVINNDGIEYIRTAERLAVSDWAGAIVAYKWPFYPFLMLFLSKATGVSYLWSGHILNTLFFTGAVLMFILTVRAFGGDSRRLTILAAVVAVIHPAFNEYRAFIIRDAGYLLAFLVALYCLARYRMSGIVHYRLGVIVAFVMASLFRIEGLVFLFCTPILFSVFRSAPWGLRWPVMMTTVVAAAALAVVFGWWLLPSEMSVNHLFVLDQPMQVLTTAWHQISDGVGHKLAVLRTEFLGQYSSKYDVYLLFGFTVFMIVATNTLSQLTVPWSILSVFGLVRNARFFDSGLFRLWISLIGMHLVILTIFASVMLFLRPRYPLALGVTALLIAPFVLQRFFVSLSFRRLSVGRRIAIIVLLLWGIGECVSGLDNFTRAQAVKASGTWLANHAVEPGSLVTNDRRIAFYSGRYLDVDFIENDFQLILQDLHKGRWQQSEYVALRFLRRQEDTQARARLEALGASLLEAFRQSGGDSVIVYRLP